MVSSSSLFNILIFELLVMNTKTGEAGNQLYFLLKNEVDIGISHIFPADLKYHF